MKHLRLSTLLLAFAAGVFSAVSGQTPLSGALSGKYPAAQYIISGEATVPAKKTLSFAAGSALRFENFAGLTVHGSLVCTGTPDKPVLFTSANDVSNTGTAPEAFDWNGIKATPEASTITLEQCVVTYSTFGLNIESDEVPVSLTNVTFHHNGSASFTRGKKMMPVNENIPFSFKWPETPAPLTKRKIAEKKGNQTAMPEPAWRKPVRISGAGTALLGAALWLTGYLRAEHYSGLIRPGTPNALANDYRDSWDSWVAVRNIGTGLFGLGATGFAVTFAF